MLLQITDEQSKDGEDKHPLLDTVGLAALLHSIASVMVLCLGESEAGLGRSGRAECRNSPLRPNAAVERPSDAFRVANWV